MYWATSFLSPAQDDKGNPDDTVMAASIKHPRPRGRERQHDRVSFPAGQNLLDWLNEAKTELKAGEVKQ
jgi:hypothetical protein